MVGDGGRKTAVTGEAETYSKKRSRGPGRSGSTKPVQSAYEEYKQRYDKPKKVKASPTPLCQHFALV